MSNAKLIYAAPEKNADLFYATHFWAPDAILFLEYKNKKYLVLSDLELERGKKVAKVDKVLSLATYAEKTVKQGGAGIVGVIDTLLKEFKIKKLHVPHETSFILVDGLREKGYHVAPGENPFYMERTLKTPSEKKWMFEAQKVTFKAIALAEKILGESAIRKGFLHWKGKILTSERVRFELDRFLLELGYRTPDIIIAGGLQATDPHCIGSGPLKPNESIIVDVFPRSDKTAFHGDATRTFCKGKASPELKKMYAVVKAAQEMAIQKIKAGINGTTIHEGIQKYFAAQNFQTGTIDGFKQGFIHGTGHGIGLEIHEEPVRIGSRECILKAGHMVTVEPGLYYRKQGGVRIEDIVFVTKSGCEILPSYPKRLEIP
ncbi:MAG: M24 family metallopeptidase [Deltaproteobacteria bacterium]|nr:M24 family metallopeptidase [Deltaproteobacteria bacterium]